MTTVTVITGDPRSGRSLVAAAIAAFIRNTEGKNSYALNGKTSLKPNNFDPNKLNDLLLVSSSDKIESWMRNWFDRFGAPLFHIHIRRLDE